MREEQVSVLDPRLPRFPSLYTFDQERSILETETHALSLHTQGEVCRLENSATPTTPQGRPAWIAFPQLLCKIRFIVNSFLWKYFLHIYFNPSSQPLRKHFPSAHNSGQCLEALTWSWFVNRLLIFHQFPWLLVTGSPISTRQPL